MQPFLILGGIHTMDINQRNILMILEAENIDDAVTRIDGLIKLVIRKQEYKIISGDSGIKRLVLKRSLKEQSYIEIKEITD